MRPCRMSSLECQTEFLSVFHCVSLHPFLLQTATDLSGRNEDYLKNSMTFARMVVVEAAAICMIPQTLKP